MKGTFKYMLLAALPVAGLLVTTSVTSAHDDWRSGSYSDSPADEHESYHEEKGARHEDFHSMAPSKREHRRFHRGEKREHRALHRDLDNEWRGYGDGDGYGNRYSNPDWYGDQYSNRGRSRGRDGDNYYGRDWWQ